MAADPRTIIARDAGRSSQRHPAAVRCTNVVFPMLVYSCESLRQGRPWVSLDRRAQRSTLDREGAANGAATGPIIING